MFPLLHRQLGRPTHASEHAIDFLGFLVVPAVDLVEQFPAVLERRLVLPHSVAVDGFSFTVDVLQSLDDDLAAPRQPGVTKFVS